MEGCGLHKYSSETKGSYKLKFTRNHELSRVVGPGADDEMIRMGDHSYI